MLKAENAKSNSKTFPEKKLHFWGKLEVDHLQFY